MPILNNYEKARLRLPPSLLASPRDDATYCYRKFVDSQQGKAVVFGFKEVRSPSQAG